MTFKLFSYFLLYMIAGALLALMGRWVFLACLFVFSRDSVSSFFFAIGSIFGAIAFAVVSMISCINN
jgi:hypothetical protein